MCVTAECAHPSTMKLIGSSQPISSCLPMPAPCRAKGQMPRHETAGPRRARGRRGRTWSRYYTVTCPALSYDFGVLPLGRNAQSILHREGKLSVLRHRPLGVTLFGNRLCRWNQVEARSEVSRAAPVHFGRRPYEKRGRGTKPRGEGRGAGGRACSAAAAGHGAPGPQQPPGAGVGRKGPPAGCGGRSTLPAPRTETGICRLKPLSLWYFVMAAGGH